MKIKNRMEDPLSHILFGEIFNSSTTPIAVIIPDASHLSFETANRAYLNLFCVTEEELVEYEGINFFNHHLSATNSSAIATSINTAFHTKTLDTINVQTYYLNRQNGIPFYWQIEHKPILDATGEVWVIIQTLIDKTETVRYEKQLEEAETKTRFHFENSAYPMIIWDFETKDIVDVNQKAIECYGYSREEFLKMSTKQLRPPEDIELFVDATQDLQHYGLRHHKIWRHIKKTGEVMFMEVSAYVTTLNGRVVSITHNQDVTERLNAEKELKASEEKYAALFMGASDAIFVADAETGVLTDANEQAGRLIGRSKEEIIGMHQTLLHAPEDLKYISEQFKIFVSTNSYKSIETSVLHKDGHKVPVLISSSASFYVGDRKYAAAYFHDLSRRKKTESVISQMTKLLQKAEGVAQIGSVEIDVETEERFYSDGFKKIMGFDDDKRVYYANDFLECIVPEDRESHVNWLSNLGNSFDDTLFNEIRIKRKNDGIERVLSVHGISIRNEQGKLTKRIGVIEDITERKQLEAELMSSHQQLKKLTEEVPLGILQMERIGYQNTTVKFVSKGIERIHTGLTPEAVMNNAALLFDRIYPEDYELVISSSNKGVEQLENIDIEFRATDVGEELKWIRLAYHPERNEDGSTSLYGYFQDITKEKKMVEALENQNKELKEIAWIQSHTVRAPLSRLMGLASLMERGKAKELGMEDYFMEHILKTCKELDTIIREIVEKANKVA